MPVGPRISEIDASLYSNSSQANPCLAVISTATKGPVGKPTLCISQRDLKNKFGPKNINCYGIYAADNYLAEVNRCYFLRVASENAVASFVNIPGSSEGSNVTELLVLEATSVGTFFDGYSVVVKTPENSVGTFNLDVKNSSGLVVSSYKDLSLDVSSVSYIGKKLEKDNNIRLKAYNGVEGTSYTLVEGEYFLNGGNDGINGITSAEYEAAVDSLKSTVLNWELMIIPGVSDPNVILKGLSLCEKRGDSFYIVDPPSGLSYEEVISWHNGEGEDYEHSSFNSSFGATYWSWQYIYDEVNSQEVLVPPSAVVAPVFARSDALSQVWFAPAGLTRGLIKNTLRSESVPDEDELDLLYTDPNNVNPIITHPTSGLAVFGQKTLWRQPTSLNRINVRRLITHIKHLAKDVSQFLTFEPNDDSTWNNFKDLIEPSLKGIKTNRGLYDYKLIKGEDIVTDEDIDNYRMPVQILIKPTKSAEYIPIDIVVTATNTNYNLYSSSYAAE